MGRSYQTQIEITVRQTRVVSVEDGADLESTLRAELAADPEKFIGRIWPVDAELTALHAEEVT